jgi:hypothetical protein
MIVRENITDYDDRNHPQSLELGDIIGMEWWARVWDKDPDNNGSDTYALTECSLKAAIEFAESKKGEGAYQIGLYIPSEENEADDEGVMSPDENDTVFWLIGEDPLISYRSDESPLRWR